MLKAYKFRIYPNQEQETLIAKHIGCARWVYNYGLERKIKAWTTDKKNLSKFDISNELPDLKKKEETNWLSEVNAQSLQSSLEHLDQAYKRFFKQKKGFPRFKSKHGSKQSFTVPQHFRIKRDEGKLVLPKFGDINITLHREFRGKMNNVAVSRTPTGKYYVSILVEATDKPLKCKKVRESTALGIDLGIKDFAVLSDGRKIENPKTLNRFQKQLVKAQRDFSRKVKGGNNRNKARIKVAKIHEKTANIRKDFLHKLSHQLTHENQVGTLVLEDLNVSGMMKNHHLARSVGDCSWSEFVRQIKYKCEWNGINFIQIGRFEPSSKLCSACGSINKSLTLKDRNWVCTNCGTEHDRDVNAAINIKSMGLNPKFIVPSVRRELTLTETRGCKPSR